MNKRVFKTKDVDGNELELAIVRPSPKQNVDSQLVYNKEWFKAQEGGSPLKVKLDDVAEKQGLWGAEQLKKVNELETEILSLERKLRAGSVHFSSLDAAPEAALKIRELRNEWVSLVNSRNILNQYSAENIADAARLQFLVSSCVVDNTSGKLYFKNFDDFVARQAEDVALDSFTNYLEFMFGSAPQSENYEDKWLKKYKFLDETGKFLLNKDGKFIDSEGHLINDKYEYVLIDGTRCDREGNPLTSDGEYVVEYVEFPSEAGGV